MSSEDPLDCAVCRENCIHPVRLPCKHVFCFLCIKGAASRCLRCPLCRASFPMAFFDKPEIVKENGQLEGQACSSGEREVADKHEWFYEGRGGWWQYEERASSELESAFQKGTPTCQLCIAGFGYNVDFTSMLQTRKDDRGRRRKVKRDLATVEKKGIAGLKLPANSRVAQCALSTVASGACSSSGGVEDVGQELRDESEECEEEKEEDIQLVRRFQRRRLPEEEDDDGDDDGIREMLARLSVRSLRK